MIIYPKIHLQVRKIQFNRKNELKMIIHFKKIVLLNMTVKKVIALQLNKILKQNPLLQNIQDKFILNNYLLKYLVIIKSISKTILLIQV